jgi:hypothetical protein
LYFLIYGEEQEPPLNDLEVIRVYIHGTGGSDIIERDFWGNIIGPTPGMSSDFIKEAITQGREILELEEFPEGWVYDTMNHHIINIPGVVMPKTKEWMRWVIDTLEVEAKKAGKL